MKILDIVPVSFLIPKIPKYVDEILYKSHFAKVDMLYQHNDILMNEIDKKCG